MTGDELGNGRRLIPRQRGLTRETESEALEQSRSGEPTAAIDDTEHPSWTELMEEVVSPANVARAMKRVITNKGSPGIDGMTVDEVAEHWRRNEGAVSEQLLAGTYKPMPVRRVTIPKSGGGERELGIPTVTDRLVQQAILQVLGPRYDAGFSSHSHGFRPHRSAHGAVMEAQRYIQEGYDWVVDVDLERFFDRVNHDVLMGRLAKKIEDKRMLKILRGFLNAGVMLNGVVIDQEEGTPQGGPLSPLLANVLLDELDKLLEAHGHRFVRYADDCNVYVRSQRAGDRVMATMRKELAKLRLRINEAKSAVDRPWNRQFLGFTFRDRGRDSRRRVSPRAIEKAKDRIRKLTNRKSRCEHRDGRQRASGVLEGLAAVLRNLSGPSPEAHPRQVDPGPAAAPPGQTVETRDDGIPRLVAMPRESGRRCPGRTSPRSSTTSTTPIFLNRPVRARMLGWCGRGTGK
jgi:RNA-directed DNA polymerase